MMLLFRNILQNLVDPRSAVLSRYSSARHVTCECQTSPTWIVYDYYHCRSSHSPLQSHSSSTDGLSWLTLTLLTHSFYPFDPLQEYVLVNKWPLLQPTVQSCRSWTPCCKHLPSELLESSWGVGHVTLQHSSVLFTFRSIEYYYFKWGLISLF